MKLQPGQQERLTFLCRITQKEIQHLLGTDRRLFADLFTIETAKQIETDPILTSARQTGHQHVSTLVSVGQKMMAEATRLMR